MAGKPDRSPRVPRRKGGVIKRAEQGLEHLAEVIESRLLDAGQVATGTSSAEVNLAAAALEAIEGHGASGSTPPERPSRPRPRRKASRRKSPRR